MSFQHHYTGHTPKPHLLFSDPHFQYKHWSKLFPIPPTPAQPGIILIYTEDCTDKGNLEVSI